MILESIVTSTNEDGTPNISPMGPIIQSDDFQRFLLRPFQTSTTYRNLKRTRAGVMHVTDDVELFVAGAIGKISQSVPLRSAQSVKGFVLKDCCRFFEFAVVEIDDSEERTELQCETRFADEVRPFWGFNRAKHAVLEAAILATRNHLIDPNEIRADFSRLKTIVEKTAGEAETRAFARVESYIQAAYDDETN